MIAAKKANRCPQCNGTNIANRIFTRRLYDKGPHHMIRQTFCLDDNTLLWHLEEILR